MNQPDQFSTNSDSNQTQFWIIAGVLSAIVVLCYGNMLLAVVESWSGTYSHGYMIPLLGLGLLYLRRQDWVEPEFNERMIGGGIIIASTIARVLASRSVLLTLDRLTFVTCLLGVFILVGGFRAFRWSAPPIAFLAFMFPWPGYMVNNIMRPMQTMATMASVYLLQTFGVDAYRDGNRIELDLAPVNVAEQCSGLKMLTLFIALCVAIAMISNHRPLWERIAIVFPSSLIIAILANVARITITALLMNFGGEEELLGVMFHDVAGLLMMPFALGLLFLEMKILENLIIDDSDNDQTLSPIGFGSAH